MTRWLLVGLLVVCGTVVAQEGEQRAHAVAQGLIGSPAPRMVLKTIDGETVDLGKLYGKKAVYLKFWATWCVPCREQMPHFEKAFESRGADLEVIAVNGGKAWVRDVQTGADHLALLSRCCKVLRGPRALAA